MLTHPRSTAFTRRPGAVDHAKKPALLRAFVLAVVMSAVADAEGYAATVRPW
jgi:hypothetical protein